MDNPRGKLNVSSQTSANQAVAADPARNVWVKANAGSGKTFVLSRRVLRLLINKVPPEEILCLTYTKAAAAEMRARVGKELGVGRFMMIKSYFMKLKSLRVKNHLTKNSPLRGNCLRVR